MTRDEVYNFLIWYFFNGDGRSELIGNSWFIYKDRFGLSLPTMMDCTKEAAQEYAEDRVNNVLEYVNRK